MLEEKNKDNKSTSQAQIKNLLNGAASLLQSTDGSQYTDSSKGKGVPLTEEWVLTEISKTKSLVLEEAGKKINEQVQLDKVSLITVFGIFASVISFLTIEFQFLRAINNLEQILGFTLILFALLFGFNVGLDYLVKSRLERDLPKPSIFFSFFIIILFIVGIAFSWMGGNALSQQKYSEEIKSRTDELDVKYDQHIKLIYLKLQRLSDRIEIVK